jgi:ATP-binding cassette, subfamily C, bacterial CydD
VPSSSPHLANFTMDIASSPSSKQTLGWLFSRVGSVSVWVGLSVGLGFCSGLLLIVQASLIARTVHGVFMGRLSPEEIGPDLTALIGVIVLRAFLAWAREVSGFQAGAKVRDEVRTAIMERLFVLGPAFTGGRKTGGLTAIAVDHVEGLHDFFAHYLPQLALAVAIPAAILFFVFPLSWAAGGLLFLTAPLIPLFMVLVGMGAESISQKHFQALARLSGHFLDVLRGLPTLKLLDRSRQEAGAIAKASSDYRIRTMNVLRVAFISSAVLEFFSSFSIALVAIFLGMSYLGYLNFGVYGQPLTLKEGLFILLLAPEFYQPLRELGARYHARAEAVGAAAEILKILQVPRPEAPERKTVRSPDGPIRFEFSDIHLAFEGGARPVYTGLEFDVAAGERVALVGESGSGKTTLFNLILGFLSPDRGRIRVNSVPLERLTLEDWRRRIGWIGQDPVLFHGTLTDNIRMGNPDAGEAAVEAAARAARVVDFSRDMPLGLLTPVGEQGYGLSRGQAQRVALARAFLKNGPVLLLDEPTAGLDTENERLVLEAIDALTPGKTVMWITHRLDTLRRADRVLLLADGRIAEEGTVAELTAGGGPFARMARRRSGTGGR